MSEQAVPAADHGTGTEFMDRNQLKYLVIIAMVIDHIAWCFAEQLGPSLCSVMHFIGRLTGPTMAFFLAEGYKHTSNRARYQKRLFIFALISWLPFVFFETMNNIGTRAELSESFKDIFLDHLPAQGVIFTLFLGITVLRIWDSQTLPKPWNTKPFPKPLKIVLIVLLTIASLIGDWPIMDVLGPFFLVVFCDQKLERYLSVGLVYGLMNSLLFLSISPDGSNIYFDIPGNWHNFGILLVPVIIWLFYNGEGGKKSAFNKWFFYIFYPAHLVVIGIIKLLILK